MKTLAAITLSGIIGLFALGNAESNQNRSDIAVFISSGVEEVQVMKQVQPELPRISESELAAQQYTQGWIPMNKEFMDNHILD